MSLASRLQTLYDWTPNYRLVFRKPVPPELKTFRVPQTSGISGWLIFTYDNGVPTCLWVTTTSSKKVPCIIDERICGDTFFRAEKIGPLDFVISDIWMYNSNCIFATSTFEQRYNWLKIFLPTFTSHVPGTVKFIHKSDIDGSMIKGYEEHPAEIARPGYFVECDGSELIHFVKMNLPDCYESVPFTGFLKVPDIKTSVYLRSKGDEFNCKCLKVGEAWSVVENIPMIE